jgi:hypothetical protein
MAPEQNLLRLNFVGLSIGSGIRQSYKARLAITCLVWYVPTSPFSAVISTRDPCFVQMGAVSFIETMDHTSLSNITQDEFEKYASMFVFSSKYNNVSQER